MVKENPDNWKSNLSPATLKALERFGPGSATKSTPQNRPELLPLPGANWELWAHMPKGTLMEAVAVSLDIDPRATKPRSGFVEPGEEYDRRLKLACAFVSRTGPLKSLDTLSPEHLLYGPTTATVNLPQFAEWALSMGWTLPERFPRLKAMPTESMKPTPAPATDTAKTAPVVAVSDGPAPLRTVTHSTKTRRDALTPVIELAQSQCRNSTDTAEVWAALLVLAERKNPPLIGATEDGLQYLKNGNAASFNRDALRKRLDR